MNVIDLDSAKVKITKQLGYFPAFLSPAVKHPAIFRSLVQQTFVAYKQNPLPVVFKEKLFVYLSRYYGIEYFTICHSCSLRSLDVSAKEILKLGEIDYPQTKREVRRDLKLLRSRVKKGSQQESQIEASMLRCASLIFSYPGESAGCVKTLQRLLGITNYNYLVILLGYIRLCHQWVKDHPEIDHAQDRRSQKYLGSLLLSQIELADFLQTKNLNHLQNQAPNSPIAKQIADQSSTASKPILEFQPETLTAFTSYLEYFPFPVMICNDLEEILFLNHSWSEATGYSTSEIATVSEWSKKAKVTAKKTEIIDLLSTSSSDKSGLMPIEKYTTQLKEIATETKNTLQKIIDSLIVMATGIAQNPTEDTALKEISIVTKNGAKRLWQVHSSILVDERDCQLTIAIAKDITDIHQANLKLKQICETTKTSTWNWNLQNDRISLGYCGCEILGLDNFDGSYSSFLSSIRPDCRESVDLSIVKTIQANGDLNLEYPIIKRDRDNTWISLRGKLNYNSQGQAIELEGIIKDITQDKLLLTTAQSIEQQTALGDRFEVTQQLETIFELIPNYIFVVDIQKNIVYVNQGIVRGFNLPSVWQVKGKKVYECFPPEYIRQIAWLHQQVLTYGAELRVQEEVCLADGIHYFNTVITPIKNEQNEVEALLHTSNDIPNLAATQEALSERTIQLEAANRELESFSYSVSHDLQAPLRIINGFSQVLWETCQPNLDERGQHFIERIQANSQKMSNLIDALLELSRVTRSQMKSVSVNLSQMAEDIVNELQVENPQRQVETYIAPNLKTTGDPQLLKIVLDNLLNNAWKYTSKRSQAKIEFNVLGEQGTDVVYYVKDNGAGFDIDYVDKLFTAFQRLHTQAEFPGTGIGLATVQRIIYRHGGRVWAEGECDRGATIYFSL